jgi:hypothetical protein
LDPREDRETADAEAGSFFFFFNFLLEPSRLNDPEAVAVFFKRAGGGVSDPNFRLSFNLESGKSKLSLVN